MSVKYAGSGRGRCKTAVCASLWLGTLVAGPALAAHYLETDCDRVNDAVPAKLSEDLNAVAVSGYELDLHRDAGVLSGLQSDTSESVRFSEDQADTTPVVRLEPTPPALTESSIESGNEFAPNRQTERQKADALDASIPGITDEELLRFKRQMYRKDI